MIATELHSELAAIKRDVGPHAYVSLSITADEGERPVYICIYPYGMVRNEGYVHVRCADFEEALHKIRAKWTAYKERFSKTITRKMALAIIRLTDEFGECRDAALRDEFDPGQIASFGKEACQLANTMASKGPFAIIAMVGANAA